MQTIVTHNPIRRDTMKARKASSPIFGLLSCSPSRFCLDPAPLSEAAADRVLHTFGGSSSYPSSGLISDGAGNYFGVTEGSVYELSLGSRSLELSHPSKFCPGAEGDFAGGNLVRDTAGQSYTAQPGREAHPVAALSSNSPPASSGSWTYSDPTTYLQPG